MSLTMTTLMLTEATMTMKNGHDSGNGNENGSGTEIGNDSDDKSDYEQ